MSIWHVAVSAVLCVIIASWLYVPSRTLASAFSPESTIVTIQQRRRAVVPVVVLMLLIWITMPRVLRAREAAEALLILATVAFISTLGGIAIILAFRVTAITRAGLEVRSVIRSRFTWDQLTSIDAVDNGPVAIIKFRFGRRKVVVDSNMNGFRAMVRALEVWPTCSAKPLADKAVRVLAKWREDPERPS